MSNRFLMGAAVVGLIFSIGVTTFAKDCSVDCDSTRRQGRVFEDWSSVVIYGGGSTTAVRTWIPFMLDEASDFIQSSVVRIVDGRILGGCTTYRFGVWPPRVVVCFGTVDTQFGDPNDPWKGSNDVVVYEVGDVSDTVGQMLADGSLVWRANFGGSPLQNNLEWTDCDPGQQTIPELDYGTPILVGPGIDTDTSGSSYLGTPAAIEHGDYMYVGVTPYDGGTGAVDNGVNIYDYNRTTPHAAQPADYLYTQAGAETFANANGVAVNPGGGRQTQPIFALVDGVYYVVFGINDTANGGSARPGMFCVDAFEDGDSYVGAIPVLPPVNYLFVDHQANGGGSNVYENDHFEMNSSGQLVALTERPGADPNDPNDPPTWQVQLYNPQFAAGRIVGFDAPILIADAGQYDQKPEDELAGPFYYDDPNSPATPIVWYNSISGVGINDRGNIAFTATYDTGVPFDPDDPNSPTIWNNAAYFYDGGSGTLHQVLREGDTVDRNPGDPNAPKVTLGLISREDSDGFFGASLADDADVMVVNFRESADDSGPSRGAAVIAVGHVGDTDFNGHVNLSDLAQLLGKYGSHFGNTNYDTQCDFDLDGDVDLADLAALLGHYGT